LIEYLFVSFSFLYPMASGIGSLQMNRVGDIWYVVK